MVIYIASYKIAQLIQEAVSNTQRTVLYQKIQSNFILQDFLKLQLEKIQATRTLIIDLSALKDSEDEIHESLNGFRLINDKLQIIIIAPYKQPGDKLLGEIFNMGIYDIITFEEDNMIQENVVQEIQSSLEESKKYKDSMRFKTDIQEPIKEEHKAQRTPIIREKVIIKTEKSVSKAMIGFIGVQARIGVTHNCIVSAEYLKKMGYSVAVIESSRNKNKVLESIKDMEIVEEYPEEQYFKYRNIDYYPNYDIEKAYKIQAKGYNFILIDFGTFEKEMHVIELSKCVKSIVILGSKPWEIGEANNLFSCVETSILEEYNYVFNFTSISKQKYLKDSMGSLKNVFISSYSPDPFDDAEKCEYMKALFEEYETTRSEKRVSKSGFMRKIFGGKNV